jgi:hypothetical protein
MAQKSVEWKVVEMVGMMVLIKAEEMGETKVDLMVVSKEI